MMRDQLRDRAYYDQWIDFEKSVIGRDLQKLDGYSDDGKAMCASSLCGHVHRLVALRYSRGDTVGTLRDSVEQGHEMLQLRRKVLGSVKLEERTRAMWENLTLGRLYDSLSQLSFMVSLRFPAEKIVDALKQIGHEGEDALLALVAARFGKGNPDEVQDSKYPKVYRDLVALSRASANEQPKLLKKYVERWYKLTRLLGWKDALEGAEGAYKGCWCFEVALVVMLLGIDDSAVSEHPHYPADLVKHYRQRV